MKRSEMVNSIAIWMEENNDDPALTQLCAADKFLAKVESMGMLPPKDNEDWIDCVLTKIEEEHKENHGYGITPKRAYYAKRGAVYAIKEHTWDIEEAR